MRSLSLVQATYDFKSRFYAFNLLDRTKFYLFKFVRNVMESRPNPGLHKCPSLPSSGTTNENSASGVPAS